MEAIPIHELSCRPGERVNPVPARTESNCTSNNNSTDTESSDIAVILRDGRIDPDGTAWSIEIPPFGESQEECRTRIMGIFNNFKQFVKVPDWLNADLLYRINYGPINEEELARVVSFLYNQYYRFESRRRQSTYRSIYHRKYQWLSIWNSMIRVYFSPRSTVRKIEDRQMPILNRQDWWQSYNRQTSVLTFLDTVLATEILESIFPSTSRSSIRQASSSSGYHPNHELTQILMQIELRLCRTTKNPSSGRALRTSLLPFAAIVHDAVRLTRVITTSMPQLSDLEQLENLCQKTLASSKAFYNSLGAAYIIPKLEIRKTLEPMISKLRPALGDLDQIDMTKAILLMGRDPGILDRGIKIPGNSPEIIQKLLKGTRNDHWLRRDLEGLNLDISNIDAAYISSGPFRLMLTTLPEKHLYLDKDGILHVFWDFRTNIGSSLDLYKGHFFWDPDGSASE